MVDSIALSFRHKNVKQSSGMLISTPRNFYGNWRKWNQNVDLMNYLSLPLCKNWSRNILFLYYQNYNIAKGSNLHLQVKGRFNVAI